MSLIAYTSNHGFPFIVGDLLISSNQNSSFVPPTSADNVNSLISFAGDFSPNRLSQKIYILKNNLCVALAGDVEKMKEFLRELKIRCSYYEEMKKEHIQKLIADYGEVSDVEILIVLVSRTGKKTRYIDRFFYGNWNGIQNKSFEKAFATGSGSEDFLKEIKYSNKVNGKLDDNKLNVNNPYYALSSTLCLIVKFLGIERYSLNTIKKYWGAGFEAIYYDGDTFRKLDDITYIVWYGRFDEFDELDLGPALVLNNQYIGDVLTIKSFQPDGTSFFEVMPIDDCEVTNPKKLTSIADFRSNRIANSYVIEIEDQKFIPICTSVSDNDGMNVSYKDGKLEITGHELMFCQVYNTILNSLGY
jgi:hypothetical protein